MAVYDDYGRTSSDANFKSHSEVPEPYLVDAAVEDVTYICFTDAAFRCVRRITQANGLTTTEFSMGAWADRATLTYQPINSTLEV